MYLFLSLQGFKNVKSVERKIKVVPSGNIADISVSYDSGQLVKIQNGEEIPFVAGETLDTLSKNCCKVPKFWDAHKLCYNLPKI